MPRIPRPQGCTPEFLNLQKRIRNLIQQSYRCSGAHAAPNPIPYDGVSLVPTHVTDSSSGASLKECTSLDDSTARQTESTPSDEGGGTYTRQHLRRTVSKVSSVASCPDMCAAELKCAPLELRYPQRRRCPTRGKVLPERAEKRARLLGLAPPGFEPSTSCPQDDSQPSAREASVQSETASDFGSHAPQRTLKLNENSVLRDRGNPPGVVRPTEMPGAMLPARTGPVLNKSPSDSGPDTALMCGLSSSNNRPNGRPTDRLIRNAFRPPTTGPDAGASSSSGTRDVHMKTEGGLGQARGDLGTDAGPMQRGFVPMPFPTPILANGSGMSMQRMMMMAAAARTSAGLSALCASEPGAAQTAAAAALAFPHPMLPAILMNRMHAYFHHICRLNAGVSMNMYVPPIDPAMPAGVLHAAPQGVAIHPKESQASSPRRASPPLPLELSVEPRGATCVDCCESKSGLLPEASFDLSRSAPCAPVEGRSTSLVQASAHSQSRTVQGRNSTYVDVKGAEGHVAAEAAGINLVKQKPKLVLTMSSSAGSSTAGQSHSPAAGGTVRGGCQKPSSDPRGPSPDFSKSSSDLPKPWTPEPVNERKQRALQPLCTSPSLCPLRVRLSETRIGAGVCKTWANNVHPTPHGPFSESSVDRSKGPQSRRRGRRARGRGSDSG